MFRQLAPPDLAAFLSANPDAILLDVREPWEHELAAIAGSTLLPLGTLASVAENELPEKSAPVIVYCHHGVRSMHACSILAAQGYTDLLNLSGGIDRYSHQADPAIPRY
jgi:rhodanese-related sulfurtransferase